MDCSVDFTRKFWCMFGIRIDDVAAKNVHDIQILVFVLTLQVETCTKHYAASIYILIAQVKDSVDKDQDL